MGTRQRLKNSQGISLIELMVAASLLFAVGTLLVTLMKKPVALQKLMRLSDSELDLMKATDFFVNDLHEAAPISLDWTTIPESIPADPSRNVTSVSFWSLHYDEANPVSPSSSSVQYIYQPSAAATTGSLIRVLSDSTGTTQKIMLSPIEAPSAMIPLVVSDPSTYHVLTINVVYHPDGQPPVRVSRRVALRG